MEKKRRGGKTRKQASRVVPCPKANQKDVTVLKRQRAHKKRAGES